MIAMGQTRLVILSGPSCVGKSPLGKALAKFYPELSGALHPLVLYNSRAPRPGEVDGVDYHFRTSEQVESFRTDERFAVLEVRGDLQALDLVQFAGGHKSRRPVFRGESIRWANPADTSPTCAGNEAEHLHGAPLPGRNHISPSSGAKCFSPRAHYRCHAAEAVATQSSAEIGVIACRTRKHRKTGGKRLW